jgi:hypothetical protein
VHRRTDTRPIYDDLRDLAAAVQRSRRCWTCTPTRRRSPMRSAPTSCSGRTADACMVMRAPAGSIGGVARRQYSIGTVESSSMSISVRVPAVASMRLTSAFHDSRAYPRPIAAWRQTPICQTLPPSW